MWIIVRNNQYYKVTANGYIMVDDRNAATQFSDKRFADLTALQIGGLVVRW